MDDFEVQTLEDGDVIFKVGDLAQHLYFIEKGVVELIDLQGKVFASANTGQSFGEAAILPDGIRSATARAKGKVICKRISATQASEILLAQSPLLVTVLEALLLQQSMNNVLRNH